MILLCIFWLFDVSLMELYDRELVTGPTSSPDGHAFPMGISSGFWNHLALPYNFLIDVGYGASRCLHALMDHLQWS